MEYLEYGIKEIESMDCKLYMRVEVEAKSSKYSQYEYFPVNIKGLQFFTVDNPEKYIFTCHKNKHEILGDSLYIGKITNINR